MAGPCRCCKFASASPSFFPGVPGWSYIILSSPLLLEGLSTSLIRLDRRFSVSGRRLSCLTQGWLLWYLVLLSTYLSVCLVATAISSLITHAIRAAVSSLRTSARSERKGPVTCASTFTVARLHGYIQHQPVGQGRGFATLKIAILTALPASSSSSLLSAELSSPYCNCCCTVHAASPLPQL